MGHVVLCMLRERCGKSKEEHYAPIRILSVIMDVWDGVLKEYMGLKPLLNLKYVLLNNFWLNFGQTYSIQPIFRENSLSVPLNFLTQYYVGRVSKIQGYSTGKDVFQLAKIYMSQINVVKGLRRPGVAVCQRK